MVAEQFQQTTSLHSAFAPVQSNFKRVIDALDAMRYAYPFVHGGRTFVVVGHDLNPDWNTLVSPEPTTLNLYFAVDGTNVGFRASRDSTSYDEEFRIVESFESTVRDAVRMAGIKVRPIFLIVSHDTRVLTWFDHTFIPGFLHPMLQEVGGVINPSYFAVGPPSGPRSKPGLFEDSLVADISTVITEVLLDSDNHAGRVVLVTADGNDRSGDPVEVPSATSRGPEDFPTHLDRINSEFREQRWRLQQEPYNPVVHLSTAEEHRTNRRFKTPSGDLVWSSDRWFVPMNKWPMTLDGV